MGILILAAVYLFFKSGGSCLFLFCLGIFAICNVAIGIFPEYTGSTHSLITMVNLIFGSLAVIFSYRLNLNKPLVILSIVLGGIPITILLISILSGSNNLLYASLGKGGTERFIIYPLILYFTTLGGCLTSKESIGSI